MLTDNKSIIVSGIYSDVIALHSLSVFNDSVSIDKQNKGKIAWSQSERRIPQSEGIYLPIRLVTSGHVRKRPSQECGEH